MRKQGFALAIICIVVTSCSPHFYDDPNEWAAAVMKSAEKGDFDSYYGQFTFQSPRAYLDWAETTDFVSQSDRVKIEANLRKFRHDLDNPEKYERHFREEFADLTQMVRDCKQTGESAELVAVGVKEYGLSEYYFVPVMGIGMLVQCGGEELGFDAESVMRTDKGLRIRWDSGDWGPFWADTLRFKREYNFD